MRWYCLRDLKRPNCKVKAYQELTELGFRVFTPLREAVKVVKGKKIILHRPVISDLLFVQSQRDLLDPIIERTPTLQYRYVRGGAYQEAMTVPDRQMEDFIKAATMGDSPIYLQPESIDRTIVGRPVRVVGGQLDGIEGKVLAIRGKKKRRVLLELPGMLSLTIEVTPDLLEIIRKQGS